MPLDLLYFAWVREAIGTGAERVDVPADVATVTELVAWLTERSDGHAVAFADRTRLRAAIDGRFVPLNTPLGAAHEVALFPPVTGG